mmetsp:Transcript_36291/g.145149  ORF Transcript_36291/g.145149 Transcript_36291/m.145149 type:complete len:208 (-) Transcript_36291:1817-2440(-)
MFSVCILDRMMKCPRPVLKTDSMPAWPMTSPPVGKSGAGTIFMSSSVVHEGLSSSNFSAFRTSRRLKGGTVVAIPTPMPMHPETRRFGILVGITVGSCTVASKFGTKSTVLLSMSGKTASVHNEESLHRHSPGSVHRREAAEYCHLLRKLYLEPTCTLYTASPPGILRQCFQSFRDHRLVEYCSQTVAPLRSGRRTQTNRHGDGTCP